MGKVFSIVFLCFFVSSIYSQEIERKINYGFYTHAGLQITDVKAINDLFISEGFSPLNKINISGGFALFIETEKFFGFVDVSAYNQSKTNDNHYLAIKSFYSSIGGGYKLFTSTDKFSLIPNLSINVYQVNLKTLNDPKLPVSYPMYINTNGQEEINGAGIGVSFNFLAKYSPFTKWSALFLGIKAGYNYTTVLDWKTTNNANVSDVPKIEPLGIETSLIIGINL